MPSASQSLGAPWTFHTPQPWPAFRTARPDSALWSHSVALVLTALSPRVSVRQQVVTSCGCWAFSHVTSTGARTRGGGPAPTAPSSETRVACVGPSVARVPSALTGGQCRERGEGASLAENND